MFNSSGVKQFCKGQELNMGGSQCNAFHYTSSHESLARFLFSPVGQAK